METAASTSSGSGSTAGTSSGSGSGNDVVTRILQNELKSVRQGQNETARMVREGQMESARILAKGKKHMADESMCDSSDVMGNMTHSSGECEKKKLTPGMVAGEDEGQWGRCWEEQEGEAGSFSVRGRLRNCVEYWDQVLHAPPWVLDTVRNGYIIPFYLLPTPYSRPNQRTALLEREFVNGSVWELQKGGYIEVAKETPVVCSPLSVVRNGVGKKRLVVNQRHVNGFLWKQKFKYEDLRVAMAMFEKGEWMFSIDLKSGYHHVDVARHHRKYLGFEWGGVTYTLWCYHLAFRLLHMCSLR